MKKEEMIDDLKDKGFPKKVIDAFSNVRRENFLPRSVKTMAYNDSALPIGHGQTISQPYTIALMLSLLDLKKGQKVLELGSGSGYVLALISEIVGPEGRVFGIEVVKELAKKSRENLDLGEYGNIKVLTKNGIKGLEDEAPFDAILISAAIRDIPENLLAQLKNKGTLVAPKGSRFEQDIIAIQRKSKTEFEMKKKISGFIFVPFVEY